MLSSTCKIADSDVDLDVASFFGRLIMFNSENFLHLFIIFSLSVVKINFEKIFEENNLKKLNFY